MHFPLFIDLESKPCLVVGAGKVSVRKVGTLRAFGAKVTTVAPEVCGRGFADSDVEGMTLVVAATDDRALNRHVADLCKVRGIPVNVVDDPENCTFIFPAIVRKGPVVAAVSSGGACPVAAKMVRDRIERELDDGFIAEVEDLGRRRNDLKRDYPDPSERKRHCEEALAARWLSEHAT